MKTLFNIISLYIVHCYFFIRQENQYSVCLMTACADPGNISEWEVGGCPMGNFVFQGLRPISEI